MLELKNISVIFSKKNKNVREGITSKQILLEKINLTINEGDFIQLSGPNGSGKTTLLRLINENIYPAEGVIVPSNKQVSRGLVSQNSRSFFLNLTVQQNLNFFNGIDSFFCKKEQEKLIQCFDIASKLNKEMSTLSSGEIKKILIIRALSKKLDLIMFDEVNNSLDEKSQHILKDYILSRIEKEKLTSILWVSHDPTDFGNIRKRRVEIKEKRLIELNV